MLGEFEILSQNSPDLYQNSNDGIRFILWTYFFMATIITQIIFLNILIAIISDSYARIMDAKENYALQ